MNLRKSARLCPSYQVPQTLWEQSSAKWDSGNVHNSAQAFSAPTSQSTNLFYSSWIRRSRRIDLGIWGNKSAFLTKALDFLIWQVVLTTNANALRRSKATAANWARLIAREALKTLSEA
jgi:hypothetical protein